jgi:hypothetical protein
MRILPCFQICFWLLIFSSFQLSAQQQSSNNSGIQTKKLELKLRGNIERSDISRMINALTGYPGKIISQSYNENKRTLYVFITDKVDPIDILQVLKRTGVNACYRDDDNGYVALEADGRTTRKLYFKD